MGPTPVAKVDVTDGVVAEVLVQPLQALADDGGAQVADVQGLCHIGPAVVHHDGLALAAALQTEGLAVVQPLQALADDGGAQVADVQGLCHIGPAVVHHDGLALAAALQTEGLAGAHLLQILLQEAAAELQIDEAGHDGLHQRVVVGVQLGDDLLGDLDGGALVLLGGSQSAVALVFAMCRGFATLGPP